MNATAWEPRWEPPGRTTLPESGLTRTAGRNEAEVTDCSERVRMPARVSTDQKVRVISIQARQAYGRA